MRHLPSDPAGAVAGGAEHLPWDYAAALKPFVRIGVTGHRDVGDPEAAYSSATEALCWVLASLQTAKWPVGMLRSSAPLTSALGYRIVSPLAEGADRLVAELVRSPDPRLRGRATELVVPLPFPVDSYRGSAGRPGTDCRSADSQAQFDRLRAMAVWARPLHSGVPTMPQRNVWYRDVGTYVVAHCDVLLALWDGMPSTAAAEVPEEERAGTADIVGFALQDEVPVIWVPVTRRSAPAARLASSSASVPRLLAESPEGEADPAAALDLASPAAQAALIGRHGARQSAREPFLERLARLEEADRCAREQGSVLQDIAAKTPPEAQPGRVRRALDAVAEWIVPVYVVADRLAEHYRLTLKRLNLGVYAAAAAAVAFGAAAAIMFPHGGNGRLLVIAEAIILSAMLAVQLTGLRRKCRDRWVTYRAMCEYLRIGRFLALVMPPEASRLEFERFARLYSWSSKPGRIPWFAPVLDRVWDHRPALELRDSDVASVRDYLIADWIDDQIAYYEKRSNKHRQWDKVFERVIPAALMVTVVVVFLHILFDYYTPHALAGHGAARDLLLRWMALTVIALTSVAAALTGYSGQQRHNYHHSRFDRMADELRDIRVSIRGATTMGELRIQVNAIRRVTLGEATSWYEGMEDQAIESPS